MSTARILWFIVCLCAIWIGLFCAIVTLFQMGKVFEGSLACTSLIAWFVLLSFYPTGLKS